MGNRAARLVGAGWLVLAAVALACFGSLVVGGWNDTYGNPEARWAGPGNLVPGVVLALMCAVPIVLAHRLAGGSRAVIWLGAVVVCLAVIGPMVATQGYIEWRRAQPTLAEQDAQFERDMAKRYGSSSVPPPPSPGIQGVFDELPMPGDEGLMVEMSSAVWSARFSTPRPEDALATLTEQLNAAGWVVALDPSSHHLTATREGYSLDVRAEYAPVQLGADEVPTPGFEGPWFTLVELTGPSQSAGSTSPSGAGS